MHSESCRAGWRVGTLLALVGSLLLAMIQILPAWEAARFMQTDASYGEGIREPRFFLSYLLPNYFNFGLDVPVMTNPGMEYLYLGAPGLVGLLLLIWFKRTRTRSARVAGAGGERDLVDESVWPGMGSDPAFRYARVTNSLVVFPGRLGVRGGLFRGGRDRRVFEAAHAEDFSKIFRMCAPAVAGRMVVLGALEMVSSRVPFWLGVGLDYAWSLLCSLLPAWFACAGVQGRERMVLFAALVMFSGVDYKVFGTSKRFNAGTGSGPNFHADFFPNMDKQAYREMHAPASVPRADGSNRADRHHRPPLGRDHSARVRSAASPNSTARCWATPRSSGRIASLI